MHFLAILEKKSKRFMISLSSVLIVVIGLFDLFTGYEIAFSLFYVVPIFLISWFIGRSSGVITSVVCALVWFGADRATGHLSMHPFITLWNTFVRFSFFIIMTMLLSALKNTMQHEKDLARTDNLTGALTSRFFYEVLQMEVNRSQRYQHPFTLAYIDLDNFKTVNDEFGHAAGDQALRTVVTFIKNNMRITDTVGRLGGDEFVLLLVETTQESARVILTKLRDGLLEEMQRNNWSITFSIGVLTCNTASPTTDELIKIADDLMYSVKRNGKNAIQYSDYFRPIPAYTRSLR